MKLTNFGICTVVNVAARIIDGETTVRTGKDHRDPSSMPSEYNDLKDPSKINKNE